MRKADEGLGGDHRARSDPRHSGLPEPTVACSAAQPQRPRGHRPLKSPPRAGVLPAISPRALLDTDLALPIGVLIRLPSGAENAA